MFKKVVYPHTITQGSEPDKHKEIDDGPISGEVEFWLDESTSNIEDILDLSDNAGDKREINYNSFNDRRNDRRVGIQSIVIDKRDSVVSIYNQEGSHLLSRAKLINISNGGCRIESKRHNIKIGKKLFFEFNIGVNSFSLYGEVVNIGDSKEINKTYGVKFCDNQDKERLKLSQLLASLRIGRNPY